MAATKSPEPVENRGGRPKVPDNGSIRLSAVVPNFNHGAVVGEAIRAIAQQVPCADEIIVVDDASTDNSVEVLERLRLNHPALRIIRLEFNRGAIFALNRGLQEARGRYIYFGAADDSDAPRPLRRDARRAGPLSAGGFRVL